MLLLLASFIEIYGFLLFQVQHYTESSFPIVTAYLSGLQQDRPTVSEPSSAVLACHGETNEKMDLEVRSAVQSLKSQIPLNKKNVKYCFWHTVRLPIFWITIQGSFPGR